MTRLQTSRHSAAAEGGSQNLSLARCPISASDPSRISLRAALTRATSTLASAGVPSPRVDAEILLAHALEVDRSEIQRLIIVGGNMHDDDAASYNQAIARRASREPLQHITGKAPFRRIELAVGPGVFIPRPETEIVCQEAIDAARVALSLATPAPPTTPHAPAPPITPAPTILGPDQSRFSRPGSGILTQSAPLGKKSGPRMLSGTSSGPRVFSGTPSGPRMLGGVGDVTVVDLCTGSGAIALAIADEIPQARVFAVERDAEAFAWAARNVQALAQSAGVSPSQPGVCPDSGAQSADQSHPAIPAENGDDPHPADRAMTSPLPAGPPPRVTLIRGDARTALPELNGTVDVVVSNPPYVPSEAIPRDPEVAEYDPPQALYGLGAEGLEIPRGIAKAAARLLKPGGVFIMEHGDEQGEAVRRLVAHVSEPLSEPESEPLSRPVPEPLTSTHPTQASPSQPTKGQPAPHASSQIQHPPTPAFTHIHTIHDLTGRDRMVHARRMEH